MQLILFFDDEIFSGRQKVKASILVLFLVFVTACERETTIKLSGGNPPMFLLSGSGNVGAVTIYGPEREQSQEPFSNEGAIWKIVPEAGYEAGAKVENLRMITYGIAPKGYKQIIPQEGVAPALQSNQRYSYWIDTTNAPHAGGFFEIVNGKALATTGPDLCFDFRDGRWIRIPCKK